MMMEDMVLESDNSKSDSMDQSFSDDTAEPENIPDPFLNVVPELHEIDMLIEDFDSHLPATVTLLYGPNYSKVYLLGTAHFSKESQDEVSLVIRNVRPQIVMVELCRGRVGILQMNEETITREAKDMSLKKVQSYIREHGVLYGIMYSLFVNMSAKLTSQLGMAPGGEFRRALDEVRNLPGSIMQYGDRPIQITLRRALSVLSFWRRMKLFWHLITSDLQVSAEDVERCKEKDVLEQLLGEMSEQFPELERVFIHERDICMTHALQVASSTSFLNHLSEVTEATRVVGVVGIGHVPGITKLWGTVTEDQIPPIMTQEVRFGTPHRRDFASHFSTNISQLFLQYLKWNLKSVEISGADLLEKYCVIFGI